MRGQDDYKFLEIRDAMSSINQKVNLIGVIIEFGFARRTKGTDWFCSVKIIDQSHQKPGITVNIFNESLEKLPHVASAGDIIQLSHVVIKTHEGETNAVFNKKFSSFALYEGKDGKDFLPYHVSPKFRPRDLDKKFISSLRSWLAAFRLDEESLNFPFVREMKDGERVNFICKVVYMCEEAEDGPVAYVWDGTDAQPVTIDSKLENEIVSAHQLGSLPLPRDKLCLLPPVGSILRLIFDQAIEKQGSCTLNTGKWVKLVNVLYEMRAGSSQIVFTAFSKLRYLAADEDSLALERQRLYDERLSLKWGRISPWSYPLLPVTGVDNKSAPFVTLMDVLTYPEVTAKFKCVVRVVAVYPSRAKDFLSPSGIYRIRLTLEDPTARIHSFLYAEDGCEFFGGYPSVDELRRKRNKLLGISPSDTYETAVRNPPWIQCCLKSYYLSKVDMWGSRQYRIFGTKLMSD